jgi:hypothetical protein
MQTPDSTAVFSSQPGTQRVLAAGKCTAEAGDWRGPVSRTENMVSKTA